jgi:imidazolonepropionase-like amidohydrolase
MTARGINVVAGTDSCASSGDLNLVDDLRLLRKLAPEMPAQSIWEMATTRAARSLGWDDQLGSITPDKRADFAVFQVAASDDPLEAILLSDQLPISTWLDGVMLRSNGRGPAWRG